MYLFYGIASEIKKNNLEYRFNKLHIHSTIRKHFKIGGKIFNSTPLIALIMYYKRNI